MSGRVVAGVRFRRPAVRFSRAQDAVTRHDPMIAISLGAEADTNLMEQVADITPSRHVNLPGGEAIGDCRESSTAVFRANADARTLKRVQEWRVFYPPSAFHFEAVLVRERRL
ncbi:MAG: hypothetical protein ACYC4B_14595 [Pirellulaceae bacterium]